MKPEVKDFNDSMEEIGSAVRGVAHVPGDMYKSAVPVGADIVTIGWTFVRYGTEGLAGGMDYLLAKMTGKE
jgi:hypothetical protein